MKKFKIFPAIGIARLGGSKSEYFLCPEKNSSLGNEIDQDGNETEILNFKDKDGLIKRQGSRFKVFELNEATGEYDLLIAGEDVKIEWQVHLVNKKSAVFRPGENQQPFPSAPDLPLALRETTADLIIDGGMKSVTGKNTSGEGFKGKYRQEEVYLGELKTDKAGNLIVLGGHGLSRSPSGKPVGQVPTASGGMGKNASHSFYYNEDWYDDTSDGPVNAILTVNGQQQEVEGAWVIVAPPDYAPGVKGVISLYDIIEQSSAPGTAGPTVYETHIAPLFENFMNHKWVHSADYSMKDTLSTLKDPSPANKLKRMTAIRDLKQIDGYLRGYEFTSIQEKHFANYMAGTFTAGNGAELPAGEGLTKVVLQTTIGQGFFPGIEGGIILENKSIYSAPFTLDQSKVKPGDITGLMALPWQADFLECQVNWWPTQRPDTVYVSENEQNAWARTKSGPMDADKDHHIVVTEFNRFGFIKPVNGKQLEVERDSTF